LATFSVLGGSTPSNFLDGSRTAVSPHLLEYPLGLLVGLLYRA
jgi:hypothetical protein